MTAGARMRRFPAILLSAGGLVVWAGHFTAIYAITALACERGLAGRRLLGLPWLTVLVGLATVLVLVLLTLLLRRALAAARLSALDGGQTEPGFTSWFASVTTVLAAIAVVFQTMPVLLLPDCG